MNTAHHDITEECLECGALYTPAHAPPDRVSVIGFLQTHCSVACREAYDADRLSEIAYLRAEIKRERLQICRRVQVLRDDLGLFAEALATGEDAEESERAAQAVLAWKPDFTRIYMLQGELNMLLLPEDVA